VKLAEHQMWNFSCRAKQDSYNVRALSSMLSMIDVLTLCEQETVRIRYGVTRLQRLDYREEAGYLRDALLSAWAQ
jgi:replication factor A1